MAINGMYSWQIWAYKLSENFYTHAVTLAVPPINAFTQVQLAEVYEFQDETSAEIGIRQVTDVNGNSSTFPHAGQWDATALVWRNQMTTITIEMRVNACYAKWIVQSFIF